VRDKGASQTTWQFRTNVLGELKIITIVYQGIKITI
jgi:hypothetical protein